MHAPPPDPSRAALLYFCYTQEFIWREGSRTGKNLQTCTQAPAVGGIPIAVLKQFPLTPSLNLFCHGPLVRIMFSNA